MSYTPILRLLFCTKFFVFCTIFSYPHQIWRGTSALQVVLKTLNLRPKIGVSKYTYFSGHFFFSGGILLLIWNQLQSHSEPIELLYNIFKSPWKFFYKRLSSVFFNLGWNFTQNLKNSWQALVQKYFMGGWKYCIKALLALSGFVIDLKFSV